jgi:hypothetical protein
VAFASSDRNSSPSPWWGWFGTRSAALVAVWGLCLGFAAQRLHHAWTEFGNRATTPADRQRADGNSGHTQIDFGGQWVMGRMIATGRGPELYHRPAQWKVVREGFPPSAESPYVRRNADAPRHLREPEARDEDIRHDADWLMFSFMGEDKPRPDGRPPIGGPLYPPVHAVLYSPLGLIDQPQRAYYLFQLLTIALTFVTGLGVARLSRGRVWWPAATLVILLYPGYRSGIDLAQNHVLSLAILVWGWVLATRGRDGLGGVVWGLLALKPTWAAAFFLVPLVMGRWRFCLAMGLTGAALGAATLPIVGLQAWFDWLEVGREASTLYTVNKNWIGLSRDLSGIPRRMLIDYTLPESQRSNWLADATGWALWAAVFVPTIAIYLWRGDRRYRTGLGAGFLFLGAYLCCYRFMYYDVLLSVLPLAVLFADPRYFFRPTAFEVRPVGEPAADLLRSRWIGTVNSFPLTILAMLLLIENWLLHLQVQGSLGLGYFATTASAASGGTAKHVPTVSAEVTLFQAWETVLLLLLWGWCLWRLVAGKDWGEPAQAAPRSASSAAPMSGERISDSPTSTA